MDKDFILLKAQNDALRHLFMSLFKTFFKNDTDRIWLSKYSLWLFERNNLPTFTADFPEDARKAIDRRRFQLQTLLDIAWLEGGLEDFEIESWFRHISPDREQFAARVFEASGNASDEESLVAAIDRIGGLD